MQGTLVMLMALSGLGCHNRACDVAYAPPTYTSCFGVGYGCYADAYPGPVMPACYAGCYTSGYSGCYGGWYGGGCYGGWDGCYGGGWGGCYGGGWGGWHGGKHRHTCGGGGLFSCFRKRRCAACCDNGYMASACYGSAYSPPVFGSALGMSYGPVTSGQSYVSGQSMTAPSKQWGRTMAAPSKQGSTTSGAPFVPSEVTTPVTPNPVAPPTPRSTTPPATEPTPPPPVPATPVTPVPTRINPPRT